MCVSKIIGQQKKVSDKSKRLIAHFLKLKRINWTKAAFSL
ncbi:hypothetical protein D929_00231 [Enterococcus faecalis 02-MB-P-10]|nr:hypothetical protein D929_00231 [Enterococcus faecalis 02-MB-P-10]